MSNKTLSIAIATYNMEDYLPRCLDSVLVSSILEKLEVLVVNDGSTDRSLEIAQQYAIQFPQTVVVIDKPNGHYGSCMNVALQQATGRYFRPLDPDDWMNSQSLVEVVNILQNADVDMLLTHSSFEYSDGYSSGKQISEQTLQNLNAGHIYQFSHDDLTMGKLLYPLLMMHRITYRTELLRNNGYHQTEGICYTDTEYYFYPLEWVHNFIYLDVILYYYFVGREGQSVSIKVSIKNMSHYYKIVRRMLTHLIESPVKMSAVRLMQQSPLFDMLNTFYKINLFFPTKCDDEKLEEIDKLLKAADEVFYQHCADSMQDSGICYVDLWRKYNLHCNRFI